MPADLIVDLPFPGPNQGLSPDMSPSTYIRDPNMLSLLRREVWHEIGPEIQKRCTLEPLPIEADWTIKQYYNRVYERLSKEKISVRIPGEGIVIILDDWQVMSLSSYVSLQYKLTSLGIREKSSRRCRTKRDLWRKNCQA